MTIDEAIKHAEEVAEKNETQAEKWQEEGGEKWGKTTVCRECAKEHRQLAEWLKDYKRLLEQEPCVDAVSREAVLAKKDLIELPDGRPTLCDEIRALPTVPAVPLDRIKEAREEIRKLDDINPDYTMDRTIHVSRNEVLAILDKLIAEVEG